MNKKVALSLSDLFCVDRHRIDFLNLIENMLILFLQMKMKLKVCINQI